ncbi:hypothetical protein N658DRAFT_484059 [Parathielavia hyrcaniae]|uniref:Uncharacterized protein n=1 Tax=Parathielavia hyrcaniae TaxID=113614 RepID=A0AAN6Q5M1_9PEZI|nr:hypothetical protein N658DRAFT_484059 [Parathielavia hyrcaniae]
MPTKVPASSSRDFALFFFKPPAKGSTRALRIQADPTPSQTASRGPREKVSSTTEKSPRQSPIASSHLKKAVGQTVRTSSRPTKRAKSKARGLGAGPKFVGTWSDWYFSEDKNCSWRARQAQDGTWDYEFASGHQEQDTTPTTSSSHLGQPLSPVPERPPASPGPQPSSDPSSPQSSWSTIFTASTSFQPEDLLASSSRPLTAVPEEAGYLIQPYPAITVTFGRDTFLAEPAAESTGRENLDDGQPAMSKNRATTSALAKWLHAKVRLEKKLKPDPKKRVRAWLKGVEEVDLAPVSLDIEGLPIYQ